MPQLMPDLSAFTGTEGYHKLTIIPGLVCTDGVRYLAEKVGAFWLVDLIASHLPKAKKKLGDDRGIMFWNLKVTGNTAVAECVKDSGEKPIIRQEIEHTDFPEGEHKFFVQAMDENCNRYCMMLPQEY